MNWIVTNIYIYILNTVNYSNWKTIQKKEIRKRKIKKDLNTTNDEIVTVETDLDRIKQNNKKNYWVMQSDEMNDWMNK